MFDRPLWSLVVVWKDLIKELFGLLATWRGQPPHRFDGASSVSPSQWPRRQISTELLIAELAADLRPTSPHAMGTRLFAGAAIGACVSTLMLSLSLGYRPDLARASASPVFWVKFAYAIALCVLSLWVLARLSRPGGDARMRSRWLALPVVGLAAVAVWQLSQAPVGARLQMVVGQSADVCPWYILLLSVPPLVGLLWAMRGGAPTQPTPTGAMIGIAAGAAAAGVYALHCVETTIPFLAVWYTLGVATTGLIGALGGARLLRW